MNALTMAYPATGANVRVVTVDGEPRLVLADVCAALEIGNPSMVAQRLDPDALSTAEVIDSMGRAQQAKVIDEGGLYEVVLLSRKPEARDFKRWLVREVLPTLRRTGTYSVTAAYVLPQSFGEALRMLADTVEAKAAADAEILALTPPAAAWTHLASSADDWSVQQAAGILARDPSITIGQQRLFQWMEASRWVFRDRATRHWMAYAARIDSGHLAHRAQHHIHPRTGEVVLDAPQVRVTAKGLAALHRALGGSAPLAVDGPRVLEAVPS